jgi:hypothetical protein
MCRNLGPSPNWWKDFQEHLISSYGIYNFQKMKTIDFTGGVEVLNFI